METPEADSIDEEDEETYQAGVLVGSVVRGRATQVMVRMHTLHLHSTPISANCRYTKAETDAKNSYRNCVAPMLF